MTVRKLTLRPRPKPKAVEPAPAPVEVRETSAPVGPHNPALVARRQAEWTLDREELITLVFLKVHETEKAVCIGGEWLPKSKHCTIVELPCTVKYRKEYMGRVKIIDAPFIEVTARRWFWEMKDILKRGQRPIYRAGDWKEVWERAQDMDDDGALTRAIMERSR